MIIQYLQALLSLTFALARLDQHPETSIILIVNVTCKIQTVKVLNYNTALCDILNFFLNQNLRRDLQTHNQLVSKLDNLEESQMMDSIQPDHQNTVESSIPFEGKILSISLRTWTRRTIQWQTLFHCIKNKNK